MAFSFLFSGRGGGILNFFLAEKMILIITDLQCATEKYLSNRRDKQTLTKNYGIPSQ